MSGSNHAAMIRFWGGVLGERAGGGNHRDGCGRRKKGPLLARPACKLPPPTWHKVAGSNKAFYRP
eukprot:647390-Pelagomonas_calceolata.AAC.2